MIILDYYSLDLQIAKEPEGSHNLYRASILENGDIKATESFELRRDLKLTQMLDLIEEKAVISYPQPDETIHIEFGKMLYNAVFSGELEEYFNKRFNEAQEENYGLRVSLQFSEDVPEIAALPWEYLHDGEDFLVTKRSVLLSRLPTGIKKIKSKPLNSVLRMLVVISSPEDPRISLLNTEKEQEIILEALDKLQKEQKIKVDFTEDATFENIQGYLNEQDYHIVHFTGHGVSRNGKGHLIFETEDREVRFIDNKTLANLFSDMGIKLVVLSSCESAKGSNKEAFCDLASMLSKRRIPAVVAMQYSVLDDVAIRFAYTFYRTIASGKSVDLALTEARISMKDSEKSNGFDFATPVLYFSDCNCVEVGKIKPEPVEFVFKPMMLPDLQVMNKDFVARKKELRILEKGFRSDVKRAAIIHGLGGLGKTVLATRLALKMNEYFDGVFGMKCTSTTRPEDILIKINSFLIMKGRSELNKILNQEVQIETKTSVLVNVLNQFRFLIILDNFEDCLDEDRKDIESPELKAFIQHLLNNTISNTKFIITTRYDFDPLEGRLSESIEHISLPELHFPQTNWLMNNYTELADLDIRKKKQIYNVVGGHPWALGQFSRLVSVQGVDSLMLDLKSFKKELIECTLLEKSFSKLDAYAKKLLIYASIYEEAVPVEALSWIIGDERDESPLVGDHLQKLIQWGLISKEQGSDRTVYTEHTIVRDFSLEKLEEEGLDKKKLHIRAAKYYENIFSQTGDLWNYIKARNYYFQAEDWENASKIVRSIDDSIIRWGYIELAVNLLNESIKTTSGVERVRAENVLSTVFHRIGDLKTASSICKKIIHNYRDIGYDEEVSNALDNLGMIYNDQGNYEEAVKLLNQSLKLKEKLFDKNGIAGVFHHLGMIHQNQGNNEEAVKMYNQSLKLSIEVGNSHGIASTLHHLGAILQDQGNDEEAMKLHKISMKVFNELGDKSNIASELHELGNILLKQGNYEEAVKLYYQSQEISKEIGDKIGLAIVLNGLGNIHYHQGNYEEAIKSYNQSLKIKEELGDKKGITITMYQLGNIHYHQGSYKEAIKLFNVVINSSIELGNKILTAYALYRLGDINYNQGNCKEAMEKYNQSLKTFTEIGDKRGISGILGQLGMISHDQGNLEKAISLYKQSLDIDKELQNKNGIAHMMNEIGMTYQCQGNYEEAIKMYKESMKIEEELGDKGGIALTLNHLGMLYHDQGNYQEAVKMYNQSLKMDEEMGNKKGIASTLGQLGRIHEVKEEYELAFQAYSTAFEIFENLKSPYRELARKDIERLKGKMGGEVKNCGSIGKFG